MRSGTASAFQLRCGVTNGVNGGSRTAPDAQSVERRPKVDRNEEPLTVVDPDVPLIVTVTVRPPNAPRPSRVTFRSRKVPIAGYFAWICAWVSVTVHWAYAS